MGQKLNIEITDSGQLLANAYYHWSAYTSSSLELIQFILDNIDTVNNEYKDKNSIIKAIKLLESTGAGLKDEEKEYILKENTDFKNEDFKDNFGANEGLISVTEKNMETTRNAEEFRATIELDTQTINFNVLNIYFPEEYEDCYSDEDDIKYKDIPVYKFDFDEIPFNRFKEITELITVLIEVENYCIRVDGDESVYNFVE